MILRGQWSATLKNRGRSKKTQKLTALKSGGNSLPVGTYLQSGSVRQEDEPSARQRA